MVTYETDDTEISDENTEDINEYATDNEPKSSEDVGNKIAASDFDPERILYEIQKALNGFDKRNGVWVRITLPLARSEFITLYINSMRSLVTFHNMFSIIRAEDAAFNMLESLKEITYAAVDYGVREEHIETFINMYDTIKSTFYGITIEGKGTENVKQVLTAVYKDLTDNMNHSNNKNGLVNWDAVNSAIKK